MVVAPLSFLFNSHLGNQVQVVERVVEVWLEQHVHEGQVVDGVAVLNRNRQRVGGLGYFVLTLELGAQNQPGLWIVDQVNGQLVRTWHVLWPPGTLEGHHLSLREAFLLRVFQSQPGGR